jgi:hypothetical protein
LAVSQEETAREGAEAHVERAGFAQAVFAPDFLETLPFAVVVAKEMHGIILAQPAVELLKELPALRLGDVRLRPAIANGPENLQALKIQRFWLFQSFPLDHDVLDKRLVKLAHRHVVMPRRDISSWNCSHVISNGSLAELAPRNAGPGRPTSPARTREKMVFRRQIFQQAGG